MYHNHHSASMRQEQQLRCSCSVMKLMTLHGESADSLRSPQSVRMIQFEYNFLIGDV